MPAPAGSENAGLVGVLSLANVGGVRSPVSAGSIVAYCGRLWVAIADWLCEARFQAGRMPITATLFRLLLIVCMCYT